MHGIIYVGPLGAELFADFGLPPVWPKPNK
jgi:hypothetical protein